MATKKKPLKAKPAASAPKAKKSPMAKAKKAVKKAVKAVTKAVKATKAKAVDKVMPTAKSAPKVGVAAPDFKLMSDGGKEVKLSDFKGKNVVLYFYPRDATPGCTIQACGFRDAHRKLESKNTVVLGVSRDSVASHVKFKEKQKLPFTLLSDPSGDTIASYGSWGEKVFMGRRFMGILRTTILIDSKGKIRKVYPKVTVKTHADEILSDLESLGG